MNKRSSRARRSFGDGEGTNGKNIDLLIAGAGPTGLTMASEALRHGLSCRIIDMSPAPSATSKALAVQPRTLEVFESMGVVEEVLARGHPMKGMNVFSDGRLLGRLSLEELEGRYPFILILEQSETERILESHIESQGIRVERQVELLAFVQDEEQVIARLHRADGSEEIVHAGWLAGCDGAHSTVRHVLGLPFRGAAYEEEFILGDMRVRWSLPQNEAYGFLSSGNLLGFFPMGGDRYRLVATRDSIDAATGEDPTLVEFQSLANKHVPVETELSAAIWLARFRLHRRIVPRLKKGRVFLAGDAAHIHSPAGGQGMNTGIQDAYNLAWKLALVTTGGAHPSLLDSYDPERLPVAKAVLRGTDLVFRGVRDQNPLFRMTGRSLAPLLLNSEWVRHRLSEAISELRVNYRHSPIVEERPGVLNAAVRVLRPSAARTTGGITIGLSSWKSFLSGPAAGDRAPDGALRTPLGESLRLFDLLKTTKHQLLVFRGTLRQRAGTFEEFMSVGNTVRELYMDRVTVYVITNDRNTPYEIRGTGFVLLDPMGRLTERYGCIASGFYLLRPDGYIAFRSQEADGRDLLGYLSSIFTDTRIAASKKAAA